jgi:hypothetical protein
VNPEALGRELVVVGLRALGRLGLKPQPRLARGLPVRHPAELDGNLAPGEVDLHERLVTLRCALGHPVIVAADAPPESMILHKPTLRGMTDGTVASRHQRLIEGLPATAGGSPGL